MLRPELIEDFVEFGALLLAQSAALTFNLIVNRFEELLRPGIQLATPDKDRFDIIAVDRPGALLPARLGVGEAGRPTNSRGL
jgi:hypothetical protein